MQLWFFVLYCTEVCTVIQHLYFYPRISRSKCANNGDGCYKPITAQYHIVNCISWGPRITLLMKKESVSSSVLSDSLWSRGLWSTISSVYGILQAKLLEWTAMPFSRGSSRPRDQTPVSCITGRFFTIWDTRNPTDKSNSQTCSRKETHYYVEDLL